MRCREIFRVERASVWFLFDWELSQRGQDRVRPVHGDLRYWVFQALREFDKQRLLRQPAVLRGGHAHRLPDLPLRSLRGRFRDDVFDCVSRRAVHGRDVQKVSCRVLPGDGRRDLAERLSDLHWLGVFRRRGSFLHAVFNGLPEPWPCRVLHFDSLHQPGGHCLFVVHEPESVRFRVHLPGVQRDDLRV